MAFLKDCLCCSLSDGSIFIGVCCMILYLFSFSLEVWWIVISGGTILATSYILCLGYFLMVVSSLFLLYGIVANQTLYLLGWLCTVIVFTVPEAGLVLFMSLYYWKATTINGLIILSFWVARIAVNVPCVMCIQSLYSSLEEEKRMLQNLQELNMVENTRNFQDKLNAGCSRDEYLQRCAYDNFGFVDSSQKLNNCTTSSSPVFQRALTHLNILHDSVSEPSLNGSLKVRFSKSDGCKILPIDNFKNIRHKTYDFMTAGSQFDASAFDGLLLGRGQSLHSTLPRSFFSQQNYRPILFTRTQSLCDLRGEYRNRIERRQHNISIDSLPRSLDTDLNICPNGIKRASSIQGLNYCGIYPNVSRAQEYYMSSRVRPEYFDPNNIFIDRGFLSYYGHNTPSLTNFTDNTDEYHDVAL